MDKLKMIQRKPEKNLREIEMDKSKVNPFASYKKQNPAFEGFYEKQPSVVSGGNFLSDFADGFKKGFSGVMDVAKDAAPYLPLLLGLGYEKRRMRKGKRHGIKPKVEQMIQGEILEDKMGAGHNKTHKMKGKGKSMKPTIIDELKEQMKEKMTEPMKGMGKTKARKLKEAVQEVVQDVVEAVKPKRKRKSKKVVEESSASDKDSDEEIKVDVKVKSKKGKRKASPFILERAKKIKELMASEGISMIDASKRLAGKK